VTAWLTQDIIPTARQHAMLFQHPRSTAAGGYIYIIGVYITPLGYAIRLHDGRKNMLRRQQQQSFMPNEAHEGNAWT